MKRLRHVVGPVTLVTRYGFGYPASSVTRVRFQSMDHLYARMTLSCLRPSRGTEILDTGGTRVDEWFWSQGRFRTHVVQGQDDLPVEAWKVISDMHALSFERHDEHRRRMARRRGWDRLPEERFRDGPLPLRPAWRQHVRGLYRRSGTFAEVRAWCALEEDEDAAFVGLRVRGKRSRSMIGDNDWEGVKSMRHKDRGWKRHRRSQWRPRGA